MTNRTQEILQGINKNTGKFFKDNECWTINNYGRIRTDNGNLRSHRIVHEYFKETLPTNIGLIQICDTDKCVNPDHYIIDGWIPSQEKLLREKYPDLDISKEELQEMFGKTWQAIKIKASKLGIKRGRSKERPKEPAIDRFMRFVDKNNETGCWEWTGGLYLDGYASFWFNKRTQRAARFAYEHFISAIPDGLVIDHLCKNPKCVNPEHLEAVTQKENVMRGEGLCAINAAKEYCDSGHEFTPENTYITPTGARQCKQCRNDRKRQYRKEGRYKDKKKEHDKKYYEENKEKISERRKKYREANKEQINAKRMEKYYRDKNK